MDTTTIHHLPVADLAAHPKNLRDEITNLAGLAKTIKEGGLIEPLVVIPQDGGHRIVAGHRRLAAAIEAGVETLPCWVREDLAGDVEQLVTMLVENIHREDLTPSEQAKGYDQLALLDVSDTKAARLTGVTRTTVKKARAVVADPVATDTLAAAPGLSFDQALAIAEIVAGPDGDPADTAKLSELAIQAPGRFEHVLSKVRQDRADAARRAAHIDELTAQGLTVVDHDEIRSPAAPLRDLTTGDQPDGEFTPLDPEAHRDCPGHAVSILPWDADKAIYWCLDPVANDHRTRWGKPARNGAEPADDEAERERKRAERRTVIANNKAWRAAEPVRRDYVRKLLAAKRVPKGTLRYVVNELMSDPGSFGRTGSDSLVADLTGTTPGNGYSRHAGPELAARAPDNRLALVLLAQHAADLEGDMSVHTWRGTWDMRPARYLAYLAQTGYHLSDIEQLVVDKLTTDDDPDIETDPAPLAEVVSLAQGSDEPNTDQPATADEASETVPNDEDTTA